MQIVGEWTRRWQFEAIDIDGSDLSTSSAMKTQEFWSTYWVICSSNSFMGSRREKEDRIKGYGEFNFMKIKRIISWYQIENNATKLSPLHFSLLFLRYNWLTNQCISFCALHLTDCYGDRSHLISMVALAPLCAYKFLMKFYFPLTRNSNVKSSSQAWVWSLFFILLSLKRNRTILQHQIAMPCSTWTIRIGC